jgi:pimeloyl-ACP methyl ester carboxylesterase
MSGFRSSEPQQSATASTRPGGVPRFLRSALGVSLLGLVIFARELLLPEVRKVGEGFAGNEAAVKACIATNDAASANLARSVAEYLNSLGLPVVGFDSLSYFWKARDPEGLALDLARVIEGYAAQWSCDKIILVGYSFGADVLPFAMTRLPLAVAAPSSTAPPPAPPILSLIDHAELAGKHRNRTDCHVMAIPSERAAMKRRTPLLQQTGRTGQKLFFPNRNTLRDPTPGTGPQASGDRQPVHRGRHRGTCEGPGNPDCRGSSP